MNLETIERRYTAALDVPEEVVVTGTPEDVARCRASHTGRFLKARLKSL